MMPDCPAVRMIKQVFRQEHPGRLAQLARASRLHRECRGFESLIAHQIVVATAILHYKNPRFALRNGGFFIW